MRTLGFLSMLLLPLSGVSVDTTEPEGFKFWSAASVNQATHDLMEPAASDPHHFAVRQLGDFPNEAVLLVHRGTDGQAEWHETQVDVIYVQSGSATLLVGGTLVNGETVAPHEKRNGTIREAFAKRLPRETGSASRRKRRISFSLKVRRNSITWS